MNHKNIALALTAIVAAVAITAVAFTVPQQAMAGSHHNPHSSSAISVTQLNNCTGSTCLNDGNYTASVHR